MSANLRPSSIRRTRLLLLLLATPCSASKQKITISKIITTYIPYKTTQEVQQALHNINLQQDNAGNALLHTAIDYNKPDIVTLLLRKHVNVNQPYQNQTHLYHFLHTKNHHEKIGLALIAAHHTLNTHETDHQGNTFLHLAIRNNYPQTALQLIQQGVNTHTTNHQGNTPLHLAIDQGYTDIALALIPNATNLTQPNHYGQTPLHLAVQRSNQPVALALIATQNHITLTQDTFSHTTPLHTAIRKRHTNIALALIPKVTNPHQPDQQGHTPLDFAMRDHHTSIALALIPKQPNPITLPQDTDGNTLLHIAIGNKATKQALALIPNITNPHQPNTQGHTPLHLAVYDNNLPVTQALLATHHTITLTQDTFFRTTLLHHAIQEGHTNIALALIPKVTNPHQPDQQGHTPLHLATQQHQHTLVQALTNHRTTPHTNTHNNNTPYQPPPPNHPHNPSDTTLQAPPSPTNHTPIPIQTPPHRLISPEAIGATTFLPLTILIIHNKRIPPTKHKKVPTQTTRRHTHQKSRRQPHNPDHIPTRPHPRPTQA